MPKPISKREFAHRMAEIAKRQDTEAAHDDADDLLCEVLQSLGYKTGVLYFKRMPKWYA